MSQNFGVSMQFKCFRSRYSYDFLLKRYNLLSLESRRTLNDMITLHSLCNNKYDCIDLGNKLCYVVPRGAQRAVRARRLFATGSSRTNAGVRSPQAGS